MHPRPTRNKAPAVEVFEQRRSLASFEFCGKPVEGFDFLGEQNLETAIGTQQFLMHTMKVLTPRISAVKSMAVQITCVPASLSHNSFG